MPAVAGLLLARGRDRLETFVELIHSAAVGYLLLARGRDRLETSSRNEHESSSAIISYSLGDAIDWKHATSDRCKKRILTRSPTR